MMTFLICLVGGHPKNDLHVRKHSHKDLLENISDKFGEIRAKIFRTPKIFLLLHLCFALSWNNDGSLWKLRKCCKFSSLCEYVLFALAMSNRLWLSQSMKRSCQHHNILLLLAIWWPCSV